MGVVSGSDEVKGGMFGVRVMMPLSLGSGLYICPVSNILCSFHMLFPGSARFRPKNRGLNVIAELRVGIMGAQLPGKLGRVA